MLRIAGWAAGTIGMALVGVALSPLQPTFGLSGALLCLLLGVLGVALIGGLWPAVSATAIAALAGDYFFTPPIHSLRIAGAADAVALVVFLAVALTTSVLVDRLLRRGREVAEARARNEALAQIDNVRTALLTAVSHDLRTPLHAIKAAATSITSEDVEWPREELREFCATIDRQADRLGALVENLLDLNRLQMRVLPVRVRPTCLPDVLAAALGSLDAGEAAVEVELAAPLPAVKADPGLLERAIANVLANAQRHSAPGAPPSVEVASVGNSVELSVIDHGPGVPVEKQQDLFKPFQRLGDHSVAGEEGLGLGLAVSKGFVESMGGELLHTRTRGGGATFTFRLRATAAEPTTAPLGAGGRR